MANPSGITVQWESLEILDGRKILYQTVLPRACVLDALQELHDSHLG